MAFDRAIVAVTVYCEASSASAAERRDVVHSIFNRVALRRYGSTPAAVCLKRMQYSEWNSDPLDNNNLERAASTSDQDPILLDCGAAFDEVKAGAADTTQGATHYHDKSIKPPPWTIGATMILETSKFFFYKDVK